jgi:hypothetical protein
LERNNQQANEKKGKQSINQADKQPNEVTNENTTYKGGTSKQTNTTFSLSLSSMRADWRKRPRGERVVHKHLHNRDQSRPVFAKDLVMRMHLTSIKRKLRKQKQYKTKSKTKPKNNTKSKTREPYRECLFAASGKDALHACDAHAINNVAR